MEKRKFKAVIFDLDGTLLDTIRDIADSVNAALTAMGFPTHSESDYKLMIGEGIRHLATAALPEQNRLDDNSIDKCLELTGIEYAKRWNASTCPYEGIPELLDELVARGIRISVFSNKPHQFTLMSVEKLLSRWHFDVILGHRQGFPVKPDPTCAIEIAHSLKIDSADFIYVGDSGVDMKTAVAAGMYPVGVLWGFRDKSEITSSGAALTIEKPHELLKLLS